MFLFSEQEYVFISDVLHVKFYKLESSTQT